MNFGDYSPPSLPSLDQQRDALRKGLGRAWQWGALLNGRLADEPLLEACLRDQRLDVQCEDSRGNWLWQIVRAVGALQRFRDRLYEIVEQRPFPDSPWLGEEEILTLDGERAFLFALRVRGQQLANRQWEWDDGSLIAQAIDNFGEERVKNLVDASSDTAISRFRESWQRDKQRRSEGEQAKTHQQRMKAVPVEEVLRAADGDTKCYWFRGWGMNADEPELQTVLQRLWTAEEPRVIANLIRVFAARALPEFDPRFIELCRHGDEEARRRAFSALEKNAHPLVRAFALTELQKGLRDGSVVGLFINNYRHGDEELILQGLELPNDTCELHWLLMDVIKVLEKNSEADCSQLGVISYALTPCEKCRFDATRLLHRQQVAPEWLKEECRFDVSEDCRKLIEKPAGSTEAR